MRARLGDDIDDYCVKCKRVMNHSVVSLMNDEPAKVRCRTCHQDHDYRHEQAPPPKVDPRKAALFNEVLKNVTGGSGEAAESTGAAPESSEAPAETKPKARKKARA
jgi:hypothetical protein